MNEQIGKVTKKIIDILGLEYEQEQPIFIGEANYKSYARETPRRF